jgi:hypothetical protein
MAAPMPSLSPWAVLVYVDSWFAGVAAWWSAASLVVILIFVFVAQLWRPDPASNPLRTQGRLAALALLLGLIVAAPWEYGLLRILFNR